MNYPWRPAAVRNIYADSAASTSSLPSDHPSNNLPIAVGTVASRISFLQKLAGNQKNKPPPKTPSRFPQSRPIRREKSNKAPQRSGSPQIRPQLNRRRENSRSRFGRRPTNIFGTPASRNSQPNEQPQTGTNHSFLGLQTPKSNHDKEDARAGFNGTLWPDAYVGGVQPGGLHGMVQADAPHACSCAPATETLKPSIRNPDPKITGHGVYVGRGIQRSEDKFTSMQAPSNPQISRQQIRVSSPHCQKRKRLQGEILNSETSTHTTSTLRKRSVRELFDKYGIERPPGLTSSEMVREEVNKPQRHRVCHLCMWIHDKNENICWKCGHRLCKACDRFSPSFEGGKETSFEYDKVPSGNQLESSKSGPYATTPRPANIQIMKNSTTRPMSIPLQTHKKEVRRKQTLNPTEPFPPFYSKKSSSPKNLNGRGINPAFYGPLNSCPGIYIPENFQKSKSRPGDSSKTQHLPPITEHSRQYITNDHKSSAQPPESNETRCESCKHIDYRSFVCRHPTSPSLARSEDVLAMNGDYTGDNSNSENIYSSRSHPDSLKTPQHSTRFYRLLNGSIHRATHLNHDSDGQDIPGTSARSYKLATGSMQRKTQPGYERNLEDDTKSKQTLANSYHLLNKPTYQPVQPNFESDHTGNSQPSDNFYPFLNENTNEVAQSEYGSDYVECRGYPRTGHWDCDRSPVSSGVLGDCQHCLDDCECSACQSTVHSVRCCTNEVHKSMIHHHHSPTKNSLNASYGSSTGQLSSELKPYILSHSQKYDRSTIHKHDSISEWLGSPDEPSPQRLEIKKITPTKAVQTFKDNTLKAITKVNDSSANPPSWVPSLKPITLKSVTPLMKKALNKASKDASLKARANLNRASSSDGAKDHSIFPKSLIPQNAMTIGKSHRKFPLEQAPRNTTDCDISGLKRRTELEQIQQKIHQWEDKKIESRRGRGTTTATASEMSMPVSRGYLDAQMRWCSSGSMQGRRGNGGIESMGSIEEEEVEMESVQNDEGHECVWRRVMDLSDKGRGKDSRDERKRGMGELVELKELLL
ncbi:hypothetical protein DID88_007429 [Monilinia fructigena]|uniref:Uncharacterized protein n=1 Tax=Monilinia fructigena TaxID=38457 RepID=A0A395J8R1_9HELO|nr:hypothetical protein DID88_007429 [Monilinia fructigena]